MITSEEQLRSLYAMPAERALLKQQVDLDRHCLRFIALSPLCIVATGGAAGSLMDASPRGGKPGFIKAPDNQTLLIPDSGGNNRLDSFSNLIADPRIVGMKEYFDDARFYQGPSKAIPQTIPADNYFQAIVGGSDAERTLAVIDADWARLALRQ